MGGIFGILATNCSISPVALQHATDSLAHRGPDDSGTVILKAQVPQHVEIGLGSRRLAVLDLSPLGHQPMQDAATGNCIVYNGEIYNFHELRSRLQREGARFDSQSDTEVLLQAYNRWGERCLPELRGMFAFAIWDVQRSRLLLGRDPMGIKPLYYCSTGQYFLFASEIRTLLGTGLVPGRLDRAALLHYLKFGSVYDPLTAVQGVFSLRAGHYLTWEKGNVRDARYYDLARRDQSGAGSSYLVGNETARKTLEDDLYAALDQAVRMQMVSDVPVGLFLSGGINSSALAGILTRFGVRLNTFSVVFQEAEYSEAEYSRVAARAFATEHQEILVSQHDALEAIPYALEAMDQPTMDGLDTYLTARQTRAAGIKVAVCGLGGDGLFGGYPTFQTVPRMERLAEFWAYGPSLLGKTAARIFSALAADTDQNRKIAALMASPEEVVHPYFLARTLFTSAQIRELLSGVDEAALKRARTVLLETLSQTLGLDPINRVSYLETRCYMLNTLLRDSDVMSMAHGLELRAPLLDPVIATRLMAMPGTWKLDAKTPKALLVGALKGALPDEIVHRQTAGFTLPFEQWLREDLCPEVEAVLRKLDHGPLASVLNPTSVQQIWEDFLNRRTSWLHVWSLYVLERWCELNSVAA